MNHTPSANTIAPIEESIQHKTEVLDWDRLDGIPCQLEYRLHVPLTPAKHLETIGLMIVAALMAPPVAALAGMFIAPLVARWEFAALALGLGAVAAIGQQLAPKTTEMPGVSLDASLASALSFLLPLYFWFTLSLTGFAFQLAGAFLFLAAAIPAGIATADRIATHTVYWMTANGYLDYATVQLWRTDWRHRFLTMPSQSLAEDDDGSADLHAFILTAMRARAAYATGLLWILAAVVVPNLGIVFTSSQAAKSTLGIQLVVGSIFGLLVAALLRSGGSGRMLVRYVKAVSHYLHYGKQRKTTPWMFQSPCGSAKVRRLAILTTVALLSVSFFFMIGDSLRQLSSPDLVATSSTLEGESLNSSFDSQANMSAIRVSLTAKVLLTLACTLILAPAAFFLVGFIFIGPLVDGYYEALET